MSSPRHSSRAGADAGGDLLDQSAPAPATVIPAQTLVAPQDVEDGFAELLGCTPFRVGRIFIFIVLGGLANVAKRGEDHAGTSCKSCRWLEPQPAVLQGRPYIGGTTDLPNCHKCSPT